MFSPSPLPPFPSLLLMIMNKLIEGQVDFEQNSDGLVIVRSQEIPQWYIDQLKEERFQNSQSRVKNEMHRAASIPQEIVDKWLREGYDVFKEPVAKSVARLKAENLDYFIASDKV